MVVAGIDVTPSTIPSKTFDFLTAPGAGVSQTLEFGSNPFRLFLTPTLLSKSLSIVLSTDEYGVHNQIILCYAKEVDKWVL